MKIETRAAAAQGVPVAILSGRFDAFEVPQLIQWYEENINPLQHNVVINMSGVEFIDSSGLSALVKGLKRCREHHGELHISNLQQAVGIIFELTRLDKAFRLFGTESEAIAGFSVASESGKQS